MQKAAPQLKGGSRFLTSAISYVSFRLCLTAESAETIRETVHHYVTLYCPA